MPQPDLQTTSVAKIRSLADELRQWDDQQLADLLLLRPDVLTPAPPDLGTLAARITGRASVQRALDQLDTLSLALVDCIALQDNPVSLQRTAPLLGLMPAHLSASLDELRRRCLVWGPPQDLRIVLAIREILGPYPAGLGPPLTRIELADRSAIDALLRRAPAGALTVLQRLTPGPPVGSLPDANRRIEPSAIKSPVEWLLAQGLLQVADADHVVLPREVGLHLRGGRVHPLTVTSPPVSSATEVAGSDVGSAAGAAAADLLRNVAELGQWWGSQPPPVLRSGGLGVRDFKRAAMALDTSEAEAGLAMEIGAAAGLFAPDGTLTPSWAPTAAYDEWLAAAPAHQWAQLVAAWLTGCRVPALIGSRGERGGVRAALCADIERPAMITVRRDALAELATLAPRAPSAADLLDRLRWRKPRRSGGAYADLLDWCLAEAQALGITGRGALTAAGQVLAALPTPTLSAAQTRELAAAAPELPALVDYVLLQGDLTAVAPGPLTTELAAFLRLAADVQSRGGATVYRFSDSSIRRILDSGWSAQQIVDLLTTHSRTPVPQPLDYLVHDLARRHGLLRVGSAVSYIRSDDEALLRELLANRRAASMQLRLLAPTVLASGLEPAAVLTALRDLRLAPAAESVHGDVVVRRPDVRRAPTPTSVGATTRTTALPPELIAAAIRAIRSDRAPIVTAQAPPVPTCDPATSLTRVRTAIAEHRSLWLGYCDAGGRVLAQLIEPLGVDDGVITAVACETGRVRTYSAHRVTGTAPAS
jgi:hypothetical protein